MSKKNKSLPFIQTHTLHFQSKITTEEWPVMAVSDGEFVRLYDMEDAAEGKTPEWRIMQAEIPTKDSIVSNGIKFQRNRKVFKGAELRATAKAAATFWTVVEGEMVAHRETPAASAPVVAVVTTEVHADGSATSTTLGVENHADGSATYTLPSDEPKNDEGPEDLKKLLATNSPKKPRGTGGGKGGKRGPRAGSVMSMSVGELQAEFTERTKQPAPSNSIHYMRKLVLGARRGQERILNRKPRKTPTIVLTFEEARELLAGCASVSPAASKVQLFITSHEPTTEAAAS